MISPAPRSTRLARPRHRVDARSALRPPAVKTSQPAVRPRLGVDRQHDALHAEHVGQLVDAARAARPPPSSPTTLSAPASSTACASATDRSPPPIVNGTKTLSAVRRASSTIVVALVATSR